jgi:hypothetical protein
MASFLGTTNLSSGAAAQGRLSEGASRCGAPGAALRLEAVGAIDRLVAPRLEGNSRLAVAAGADGHEQLTPGCSAIAATAGIACWPERIRALGLACRAARRAPAGRIVKTATRVELLLTTGKHERRIAIAAGERLVCVLHADSPNKKWWKLALIQPVTSARRWEMFPVVAPKNRSAKLLFQPRASIRGRVKPPLQDPFVQLSF